MKFNKGEIVYYKNMPCRYICEINYTEAVVEIMVEYSGEYGPESVEQSIIVNKEYLMKEKFDKETEMTKALKEVGEIKALANMEAENLVREAKRNIKNLENEYKRLKEGEIVLKYLQGKLKYGVSEDYGAKMIELSDLADKDDYYSHKKTLKSLSIIRDPKTKERLGGEFIFTYNRYGDGSGDNTRCKLFETLEEAKEEYIKIYKKCLKEQKFSYLPDLKDLEHWKIEDAELLEVVKKQEEKVKNERIQSLNKAYADLAEKIAELNKEE